MTEDEDIAARIAELRGLLREVHGIRGRTLGQALRRSKLVLPRRIRRAAQPLADAEPLLGHPRLQRMVDSVALRDAHAEVSAHLKSVDVADKRRGRLLGIAGAVAVNVILVAVLFVAWIRWAGPF